MPASIEAPEGLKYGDSFWFITEGAGTDWVKFKAYQPGKGGEEVLVYSAVHALFPGGFNYGVPFQCGPSMRWVGGAASCVGEVGYMARKGRWVTDTSVAFHVGA